MTCAQIHKTVSTQGVLENPTRELRSQFYGPLRPLELFPGVLACLYS